MLNRLALISTGYPPYMWGGIDVQTYDIAHALSNEGVNVTVFCGCARKPTLHCENDNLKVCRLPVLNAPPHVVWFQLRNLRFLSKKLMDYQIVHSQHSSGTFYAFLKNKVGKPWVVSFHDHQLTRLRIFLAKDPREWTLDDAIYNILGYPLFEFMSRIELGCADHYIVCGTSGLRDYVGFNGMDLRKTTLIPNGINFSKIDRLRKSNESQVPTIFTCGRLVASKGTDYLVKAMPVVLKENKEARLKIFGRGPMMKYLKGLIDSLDLTNNVTLEGHVPYSDLISEMSLSTIIAFPTMVEVGVSIAVLEAMACGKPVIAFDFPFTRDIIHHSETGYLVPPKDKRKLAEVVNLLLKDKSLRNKLGENANTYVRREHDYQRIIKRYLDAYEHLLEDN